MSLDRNATSIKRLLEAETSGKQRIAMAKENSAHFLKEVKAKALAEIESFKRDEERKIEQINEQNVKEIDSVEQDLKGRVSAEMAKINKYATEHMEQAVNLIVSVVLDE